RELLHPAAAVGLVTPQQLYGLLHCSRSISVRCQPPWKTASPTTQASPPGSTAAARAMSEMPVSGSSTSCQLMPSQWKASGYQGPPRLLNPAAQMSSGAAAATPSM